MNKEFIFLLIAGLGLIAAFALMILYLQQRKRCREVEKQLSVQQQRVLDRKKKIAELRSRIAGLNGRIAAGDKALLGSFSPEEVRQKYDILSSDLSGIISSVRKTSAGDAEKEELAGRMEAFREKMAAVFRVTLQSPEDSESEESRESAGYAGCRILVADDNLESLKKITDMLEARGIHAESAQSGEEVLEKFEKSREEYYSMIIMDIVMEGMRGYEAAKRIRSMYRSDSNQIPIVAVTANSFTEDMAMIQNAGMNERIIKPVTEEKLFDTVKKWIGVPDSEKKNTNQEDLKWKSLGE